MLLEKGLLQSRDNLFTACSPDGVRFLLLFKEFHDLSREPKHVEYVNSEEVVLRKCIYATVEVKTMVADSALVEKFLYRTEKKEPLLAGLGFPDAEHHAEDFIPTKHLRQCVY